MRSKRALISTLVAFALQIINILSALIVPRMIIGKYGSDVNGLVQSITQFLGYISLLQLGVGGVVRAALYKPLADNDNYQISRVVKASDIFFKKVGIVSLIYVIVLGLVFPFISKTGFGNYYVFGLVLIVGVGTIAQYMFGIPARLLIMADQRAYIYDFAQIIAVFLNIVTTILLINIGLSVHLVKLGSAVVFVIQPVVLYLYVNKRYSINHNVKPDNKAVEQRWSGMAYSLADFVHRKTDIFVLTIAASLQEVSVYSVYAVVTNGLNSIITMATTSFQAALGDMLAREENDTLHNTMNIYITLVHVVSCIVFSVALVMIVPFITVYTKGITDIDYVRKSFAVLIILAELVYCLRQPYQSIIIAAGKFRETQKGAIVEALLNIVISLIFVSKYGIIGVAVGTLIAMIYRTVDLIIYLHNHLIFIEYKNAIYRYLITFCATVLFYIFVNRVNTYIYSSYFAWILGAGIISIVSMIFVFGVNFLCFRTDMLYLAKKMTNILRLILKRPIKG